MARRIGVGAVLLLTVAAAPARAETVTSGPLRADTADDPWRVTFADSRGPVLAEHTATGAGSAGTLGFRALGEWRHATRVVSKRQEGSALVLELATTDPLGGRIEARLEPAGDGVIRLRASAPPTADAVGIGFDAAAGERFLGFGERSNAVDQRGNEVENYVSEGPFQTEEEPFVNAFVPSWGYRMREDATYFPMPWLLSTRGYGALLDNPERSVFRLASATPDAWSVEAEARELELRVFAGPRPADVVRRLTEAIGRQPAAEAPFFFGPWVQPTGNAQAQLDQLRKLQEADAPVSLAQTYLHYLPCGDQQGGRDRERERTAAVHAMGLAITTYFNPMICVDYQPAYGNASSQGALTANQLGQPYVYRYNEFVVSQFDFTAEAGRRMYADLLTEAVEDGHDGWMEDFGEYTPLDSRSADGSSGTVMHNRYPLPYHCTAHDFAQREPRPLARFVRSGWTGVAPCAPIVWNGDPTTDWGFDGLESAVKNALTLGLSGISTWGSDIGGFFALGQRRLTPELLIRWVQLGAVSPVMRTQANGFAVPPKTRPQVWEDEVLPHWRRWAKLHTQLYPYIVAAESAYLESGLPIVRHLSLAHPDDPAAAAREDEFLFGPDLLAAPVVRPGETERRLYLPPGRWVDLWRSVAYREADGGLRLGRARHLSGGAEVDLPAPLEELPLLARTGAVIPLLPADVDTLSDHGDPEGIVKLAQRRKRLHLLAFPRGRSRARFGRTGRITSRERRGRWVLRVRGPRRRYSLQASLATLKRPFRPCRVTLNGRRLRRRAWRYDREARVLRARFRAGRSRLAISRSCR